MRLEQSLKQRKTQIIFGDYITKKSKDIAITPNYIRKVFAENGVIMTRPQIDRYVNVYIKNDSDFNNFKTELREIGCENMKYKMHREMAKYKHQIEKQKAEV